MNSSSINNCEKQQDEIPAETLRFVKNFVHFESLPRVRHDSLVGIGGKLKEKNEFFVVEEIPLWAPDGKGSNCVVRIRRNGATTKAVQEKLARLFRSKTIHIGYAGLKDKIGICTQNFSINFQTGLTKFSCLPSDQEIKSTIESDQSEPVLECVEVCGFNSKKLKTGQLKGNTFKLLVTNLDNSVTESVKLVKLIVADIKNKGIPNYYGVQRVGIAGRSSIEGFQTIWKVQNFVASKTMSKTLDDENKPLKTDGSCHDSKRRKCSKEDGDMPRQPLVSKASFRKWCKKNKMTGIYTFGGNMKLNAFQSGIFNGILGSRIRKNMFTEDSVGDVLMSQYGGKIYKKVSEEMFSERKDEVCFTFTCPVVGSRNSGTTGNPRLLEQECLQKIGISQQCFKLLGLFGSNRPGRLFFDSLSLNFEADANNRGVWFSFSLPKGAFATSLMREFM